MITDPPAPEPPAPEPAGHMRTLSISGRIVRVAVREGRPDWPLLLLCSGIGARLDQFQPFVDALDPQRAVIRFDMPGTGGSPRAGGPLPCGHPAAAADRAARPARL
jgi:pimeloyl-ACP methyl ester carboxylesterase